MPSAPPNDLGLTAVVDQFREDELLHLLQVRVTNTSGSRLRITSMQLQWPGMTIVDPTPRHDLISPGQVLDVPIDYGVAACAESPPGAAEVPPSSPAVAVATVVPGDSGPESSTTIPIADQLHIFERIFPPSCRDQRIADAATIRLGDTWTPTTADGVPALAGKVVVQRHDGDRSIALTKVGGSVLLSVRADSDGHPALLTVAPGTPGGELAIVVTQSGNCSGHALTESKKTYVLPVEVSLGGEAPIAYELTIDVARRGPFVTLINTSCHVG